MDRSLKEAKVWAKDRPKTEVVDFDLDFFFLVLMQLKKYTDQTKIMFLNQLRLFFQYHQIEFMKCFQA